MGKKPDEGKRPDRTPAPTIKGGNGGGGGFFLAQVETLMNTIESELIHLHVGARDSTDALRQILRETLDMLIGGSEGATARPTGEAEDRTESGVDPLFLAEIRVWLNRFKNEVIVAFFRRSKPEDLTTVLEAMLKKVRETDFICWPCPDSWYRCGYGCKCCPPMYPSADPEAWRIRR